MQNKKNNLNEETLNKIISTAYKDAGLVDRLKVYFLTKKDAEAKKIFNEYRITAQRVKNIQLDKYPGSLVKAIKIMPGKEKKSFGFKPVFAVSLLAAIITITVIWFNLKEADPVYSEAEIELAEKQMKESLVIVNKVFKKTEDLILEEVLQERIGKPVNKSLKIINNVLTGG